MLQEDKIWMAQGDNPCYLLLDQANRHGIIAGASGTGKTVTLKTMAEGFSQAGVPVFMADVKGDVTGMCQAGDDSEKLRDREKALGFDTWEPKANPCRFWDMLGGEGIPVRIRVSDMGPVMLARLLKLTDVQEGVLNIVFRVADDNEMLLIDLKDLKAMLGYVGKHAKDYETDYGHVSSQSIGAIQRALIAVEDQGGDLFFGEPALDLNDWFACDANGAGYVNILNAAKLINAPQIYAMFLLWMLSELFETLPEVGDPDKPKFAFFFDEAHLLFDGMPEELTAKIIQVVKLIRSKGVGVYFITQSPADIPDEVLAQLSNRIQHGLRAYTPAERKSIKAAAESFRANEKFDTAKALEELGTGEALVSFLNEDGQPEIVERAKVLAPLCRMAAADPDTLEAAMAAQSALMDKYGAAVDNLSAYEKIAEAARKEAEAAALAEEKAKLEKEKAELEKQRAKEAEKAARKAEREAERKAAVAERRREKEKEAVFKTGLSIVGQIGRQATRGVAKDASGGLLRGLLGGLLKL